jgi:gamma-glutamyltranspeptidase/glutathione hydrolase
MPAATLKYLAQIGHLIELEPPDNAFGFGGAQLLCRLADGAYAAGSDPRKDGLAAGF